MTDKIIKDLEKVRYHLTASQHKAVIDDAIETLLSQKVEIERLHSFETYRHCRAKAIKDFAETVKANKNKLFNYIYSSRGFDERIDNLVKEMVGEC